MGDNKMTVVVENGETKVLAAKRVLTEMGIVEVGNFKVQIEAMEVEVKAGQLRLVPLWSCPTRR